MNWEKFLLTSSKSITVCTAQKKLYTSSARNWLLTFRFHTKDWECLPRKRRKSWSTYFSSNTWTSFPTRTSATWKKYFPYPSWTPLPSSWRKTKRSPTRKWNACHLTSTKTEESLPWNVSSSKMPASKSPSTTWHRKRNRHGSRNNSPKTLPMNWKHQWAAFKAIWKPSSTIPTYHGTNWTNSLPEAMLKATVWRTFWVTFLYWHGWKRLPTWPKKSPSICTKWFRTSSTKWLCNWKRNKSRHKTCYLPT